MPNKKNKSWLRLDRLSSKRLVCVAFLQDEAQRNFCGGRSEHSLHARTGDTEEQGWPKGAPPENVPEGACPWGGPVAQADAGIWEQERSSTKVWLMDGWLWLTSGVEHSAVSHQEGLWRVCVLERKGAVWISS